MRGLRLIWVLVMGGAGAWASALTDADELFAKGDFAGAARAYETALASGGASVGATLNLATALEKSGDLLGAALNFRRTILLDPGSADARMGLSRVERGLGVAASAPTWLDWVAERLPLEPLAMGGAVLAWIGAFAGLFGAFRPRPWDWLVPGVLALVCGVGVVVVATLADPRFRDREAAIVVAAGGTKVLSQPADQSERVAALPAGSLVTIVRRRGVWDFCRLPSGAEGWIASAHVLPVVPPQG